MLMLVLMRPRPVLVRLVLVLVGLVLVGLVLVGPRPG